MKYWLLVFMTLFQKGGGSIDIERVLRIRVYFVFVFGKV